MTHRRRAEEEHSIEGFCITDSIEEVWVEQETKKAVYEVSKELGETGKRIMGFEPLSPVSFDEIKEARLFKIYLRVNDEDYDEIDIRHRRPTLTSSVFNALKVAFKRLRADRSIKAWLAHYGMVRVKAYRRGKGRVKVSIRRRPLPSIPRLTKANIREKRVIRRKKNNGVINDSM